MSWAMSALAAQNEYKPMPWGSDPWVNRLGPTPEMTKAREAELASQRAEQAFRDQQAANADETQAYRGNPRLDTGLQRAPGSVAATPVAQAIGDIGGAALTDPTTYVMGGLASTAGRALLAGGTAASVMQPTEAHAMLGGVRTATPRQLKALDRAKDMLQSGQHTAGEIWRDAKWDKFKDGQWRYEIPGRSGGGVKEGVLGKLRDVWKYPQLYDRYPALGDLEASVGLFKASDFPNLHPNTAAFYLPNRGIHILKDAPKNSPSPKWLLQHEGTHGIQELENFARGDSPLSQNVWDTVKAERATKMQEMRTTIDDVAQMRREWIDKYLKENKLNDAEDYKHGEGAWRAHYPNVDKDWKIATDEWNRLFSTDPTDAEKMRAYMRSHGETEANMVPDRAKFMQQSLTERPPSTDMHWVTPYDEQIVNFNNPMMVKKMGGLLGTGR